MESQESLDSPVNRGSVEKTERKVALVVLELTVCRDSLDSRELLERAGWMPRMLDIASVRSDPPLESKNKLFIP